MRVDRRTILVAAVILLAAGATWAALEGSGLSDRTVRQLRGILVRGVGLALAALFGAVALAAAPWWVAAALAATVLVATRAYDVMQQRLGLPALPAPQREAAADLPDPCEVGPYVDAQGVLHVCGG